MTASAPPPDIEFRECDRLVNFEPATEEEIVKLLSTVPAKSWQLDSIPSSLVKRMAYMLAPVICKMCNVSLQSCTVPASHKQAIVKPRLKKPSLDTVGSGLSLT